MCRWGHNWVGDEPMAGEEMQSGEPRLGERLRLVLGALRGQFRELYGDRLVKILLYGSQARGDATRWSDIDLLVVLKGRVRPGEEITRTGGIVTGVCLEYDVVVQCLFMDEARFLGGGFPITAHCC